MYDDFLVDAATETPQDDAQKLVHDSLKRAFAMYELDRAKDTILQRILRGVPGSGPNLERQNLELDVALKRRRLGLQDTQEFDRSVNDQLPLGPLLGGSMHFLNRLPSVPVQRNPSFLGQLARDGAQSLSKRFGLGIF